MITFLNSLYQRNEILFWFGLLCFVSGIFCFFLAQLTSIQVLSINAWIKPMKFYFSVGIFVWTMAWFLDYLKEPRVTFAYSWVAIITLGFEVIYISLKASQGQLSHFNISSPLNGFLFAVMGIIISVLTLWTGYIGYLFFKKEFPELPLTYIWGIRLGILLFVVFAFEGGLMAARLSHTVGAADGGPGIPFVNWSTRFGDLRIAHFVGMHALQILPLLSFYVFRDVKYIFAVAMIYFLITSFLFVQALAGKPLIKL
jgi:hypothetical protein